MDEDRGSDRGGEDRRAGAADRDDVDAGAIDQAGDDDFDEVPEEDDFDDVQDDALERRRERTEHVEDALSAVRDDLGDQKYPVSSEELSVAYADQPIDLPNETESLGSVFRRIDETFEDEAAAYEAVVAELSTDERVAVRANAVDPEAATWSEERAETQHEFDENALEDAPDPNEGDPSESSVVRSRRRAREAQADADDEGE